MSECNSEIITKIGPHLPKLSQKDCEIVLFWLTQCTVHQCYSVCPVFIRNLFTVNIHSQWHQSGGWLSVQPRYSFTSSLQIISASHVLIQLSIELFLGCWTTPSPRCSSSATTTTPATLLTSCATHTAIITSAVQNTFWSQSPSKTSNLVAALEMHNWTLEMIPLQWKTYVQPLLGKQIMYWETMDWKKISW